MEEPWKKDSSKNDGSARAPSLPNRNIGKASKRVRREYSHGNRRARYNRAWDLHIDLVKPREGWSRSRKLHIPNFASEEDLEIGIDNPT